MKRNRLIIGSALITMALGLNACYNEPDFESSPNLIFRDLEQHTLKTPTNVTYDSLVLVVRFQDGDGDLGLSDTEFPEDNKPPFSYGEKYFYNIFVNIYKKQNGQFSPILVNNVPLNINGRFPRVSTDTRVEPLEGDIRYTLDLIFDVRDKPIKRGDTLRFDAQIVDRAQHFSPVVTSSEVIVFGKQ